MFLMFFLLWYVWQRMPTHIILFIICPSLVWFDFFNQVDWKQNEISYIWIWKLNKHVFVRLFWMTSCGGSLDIFVRIFSVSSPIYSFDIWTFCCELTFHADLGTNPKLRILAHNRSSNAYKCNKEVQRLQIFTLIIMMPLQFELSQSSSNSWHVRQTCHLALTHVTTEIMIWQSAKLTKTMRALICYQSRHKNTH